MARHGRATLPFGKYKGVRLRLLPDSYLSWLTTIDLSKFWWVKESLAAELRHRGMNAEAMEDADDEAKAQPPEFKRCIVLVIAEDVLELKEGSMKRKVKRYCGRLADDSGRCPEHASRPAPNASRSIEFE